MSCLVSFFRNTRRECEQTITDTSLSLLFAFRGSLHTFRKTMMLHDQAVAETFLLWQPWSYIGCNNCFTMQVRGQLCFLQGSTIFFRLVLGSSRKILLSRSASLSLRPAWAMTLLLQTKCICDCRRHAAEKELVRTKHSDCHFWASSWWPRV